MKRILLIAVIISILLLGTGCSKKQDDTQTVRIACFPNITHSQALVMKEQKRLESKFGEHYKVSWYTFNAGPAEVEAMFTGKIDIGYIGPVPAINANVKSDGDVKIIANSCEGGAVLVTAEDAHIHSVEELDGKTISVPQLGNTQHLCLLNLLTRHNLAAKSDGGSVEIAAVANADVQGMLKQNQIDAAFVPEPWGSILEENCNAKIIMDYDEIFQSGAYPSTVIIVNRRFYEEHREIVQKFLEVNKDTTDFICMQKGEAIEIINSQLEKMIGKRIDRNTILHSFERMNFTDKIAGEAVKEMGKTAKEQGFISELPSYEELVDTSLIEEMK